LNLYKKAHLLLVFVNFKLNPGKEFVLKNPFIVISVIGLEVYHGFFYEISETKLGALFFFEIFLADESLESVHQLLLSNLFGLV
jgi:hypothetical protein